MEKEKLIAKGLKEVADVTFHDLEEKKSLADKSEEEIEKMTEEEIIREVAEEEGMTYEEVKEMWDTFKDNAHTAFDKFKKNNATKPKRNHKKVKAKRKQAKKARKKNRK